MRYGLIVVGGGLVGAGLVRALRHTSLPIALIDARLPSSRDPRLFALNATSCQFLENLEVWSSLASFAAPIHQVHVSHQGHFGSVRLDRSDVGLPALGNVIPAKYIEGALNEALQTQANVTLYRPARLQALKTDQELMQLTIAMDGHEKILQAPLVIGADGTESTVRSLLNIAAKTVDYQQSAIVTRTTLQRTHANIAYERFTANSTIAMLPLPGNECATIWSGENQKINQLMNLSDEDFLQALQREFGYRLGRLQALSERHFFPLRSVQAESNVQDGVVLIGNAAHTVHPVAAQGFNLALYEVAVLAEGMINKLNHQQPISALDLKHWMEQSEVQQTTSIGVSHRLSQLFSKQSIWRSVAVQLGMVGMDMMPAFKKRFISKIMGRSGRVPSLLLDTKAL